MAGRDELRSHRSRKSVATAPRPEPARPGIMMQGDDSQLQRAFENVAKKSDALPAAIATVVIELPVGAIPEGVFVSRHVDVQLKGAQARAMRRLFEGLLDQGAKLANGRRVASPADAVRYVLERIVELPA